MNLDVEMAAEMVRLQEENTILKKALELACKNLFDYNNEKYNYFIEQAKESMK